MRLGLIAIVFIFLSAENLQAKNINYITLNTVGAWEEIVLLCRQKKVPLFVTCTNEAKIPQSEKTIQNNTRAVKFANKNYVSVYINDYSQLGKTFKSLFRLDDTTHHMVLNPAEEVLLKQTKLNYEFFEEGFRRFEQFDEIMLKHYNRALSKEEWLIYLDIKYNNFGYLGTVSEAKRFIPKLNETDLSNPKVWPFITKLCLDINNSILKTLSTNTTLVENPNREFPWLEYYINVYNLNLSFAIDNKDSSRMSKIKEELVPLYPNTAKREHQKLLVEQQYLAALEKWKSYEKLTFSYLKKNNEPDDYYTEFDKLYYSYPFNKISDLLEEILEEGIEQKSTYKLNYNMAELLIAKGQNDRAWEYVNAATKKASNAKEETQTALLKQYLLY